MKIISLIMMTALLLLVSVAPSSASSEEGYDEMSLWIGGTYYSFEDYAKKVYEYGENDDGLLPELSFHQLSQGTNSLFGMKVHFEDTQNILGRLSTTVSDRFKASFKYVAFTRQLGQDLLENLETREAGGGKILTHELLDAGNSYHINRDEILSKVSVLLSRKHNVRLLAAHRAIVEEGSEQSLASTHCYSCHISSREKKVNRSTHALEAALEAEAGGMDIGYQFGYRHFSSNALDPEFYFDRARHPVNGGAEAEFESRLIYYDSTVVVSPEPTIEKIAHKLRLKGNLGKGRFASSLSHSNTTNEFSDLNYKTWAGAFKYTVALNGRTRLTAKMTGSKTTADDLFIDLPLFRDGRAGTTQNFDYLRYSTLDRTKGALSAEVIRRLNPRTVLSILGEYNRVDRDNYPTPQDGITTSQFVGQARLRYHRGLSFSFSAKYRFEKTSDPFSNWDGIFESRGNGVLGLLPPDGNTFIFYFQREDLRYQTGTTVPTDRHNFDVRFNYRPQSTYSINLSVKGTYDKNGDLDSLDVNSFALRPNLSVNYTPNPKVSLTFGFNYDMVESQGPIAVALFDG